MVSMDVIQFFEKCPHTLRKGPHLVVLLPAQKMLGSPTFEQMKGSGRVRSTQKHICYTAMASINISAQLQTTLEMFIRGLRFIYPAHGGRGGRQIWLAFMSTKLFCYARSICTRGKSNYACRLIVQCSDWATPNYCQLRTLFVCVLCALHKHKRPENVKRAKNNADIRPPPEENEAKKSRERQPQRR